MGRDERFIAQFLRLGFGADGFSLEERVVVRVMMAIRSAAKAGMATPSASALAKAATVSLRQSPWFPPKKSPVPSRAVKGGVAPPGIGIR